MTKTIICAIFTVFTLLAGAGAQAGLQDAIDAYGKGNYSAALKEFKRLAAKGDAEAQSALGFMYASGHGVKQDYKKAAVWYRKAAEQNYAAAQFNLGVMYANGQGVPQDVVQAHKFFSLAELTQGEVATNNRKLVEADMTPAQIEEAQRLAREWQAKPEQPGQHAPH